jgi:replication initiation protein RepC
MESVLPTTPFGRRPLALAHIASQMAAKHRPPEATANKWTVFQDLCTAKLRLALPERSLTVLEALLTFHPETVLTGADLIVFPSNDRLALRAKGMAPTTMRRHLAVLVDAGVIIRRDSPNGKRFARKTAGGLISQAFGFDLTPIVARAAEFKTLAEEVQADQCALRYARQRISLARRDIVKIIATGLEEGVPIPATGQGPSTWEAVHALYRTIAARIPRAGALAEVEPIAEELTDLADRLLNILETHIKTIKMDANDLQNGRHIQSSNTKPLIELEPSLREAGAARAEPNRHPSAATERSYPLGMILKACPDIADYAKGEVSSWRDLLAAAAVVRPMMGISPSAWEEAQAVMSEAAAAIVVACILQRGTAIHSAGGYLRELTRKAESGQFSVGPMLMALIGRQNAGEKKRA